MHVNSNLKQTVSLWIPIGDKKILKGDNFAQIQTYYITAHKNRIIEA